MNVPPSALGRTCRDSHALAAFSRLKSVNEMVRPFRDGHKKWVPRQTRCNPAAAEVVTRAHPGHRVSAKRSLVLPENRETAREKVRYIEPYAGCSCGRDSVVHKVPVII